MKFLSVISVLAALSAPGHALSAITQPGRSVTLAWDPSTDSDVAGYKLYYGVASRAYTNMVSVGKATRATISGLVEGVTYFFAATTYSGVGLESGYSNEASYTIPMAVTGTVPKLQILMATNGQVVLTATGQVGHKYDIQATRLFKHWTVIGTGTVGASGSFEFVDTNAASFPARFYRLSEVLPGLPKMQIRVIPTNQVVLTVTGQSGHLYDILATQTFSAWTVIGSVAVGDRGSIEFVDPNAAMFPARYYRARDRQP